LLVCGKYTTSNSNIQRNIPFFQGHEDFSASDIPYKRYISAKQVEQGLAEVRVLINEPPVEVGKTQKAPYILHKFHKFRDFPVKYGVNLLAGFLFIGPLQR